MNRTLRVALGIIVLLGVVAGSFYGGTLYGKQQARASLPEALWQRMGTMGRGDVSGADAHQSSFGRFDAQGGGLIGQIEEIDGECLIITNMGGQQTRVQITDTTLIEKYASVTTAELEPGEQVIVSGSENEDGSITARSVQVAPAGRFAPGGRMGSGGAQ